MADITFGSHVQELEHADFGGSNIANSMQTIAKILSANPNRLYQHTYLAKLFFSLTVYKLGTRAQPHVPTQISHIRKETDACETPSSSWLSDCYPRA